MEITISELLRKLRIAEDKIKNFQGKEEELERIKRRRDAISRELNLCEVMVDIPSDII